MFEAKMAKFHSFLNHEGHIILLILASTQFVAGRHTKSLMWNLCFKWDRGRDWAAEVWRVGVTLRRYSSSRNSSTV